MICTMCKGAGNANSIGDTGSASVLHAQGTPLGGQRLAHRRARWGRFLGGVISGQIIQIFVGQRGRHRAHQGVLAVAFSELEQGDGDGLCRLPSQDGVLGLGRHPSGSMTRGADLGFGLPCTQVGGVAHQRMACPCPHEQGEQNGDLHFRHHISGTKKPRASRAGLRLRFRACCS